nr:MAG TPA: RRN7 Zinc-finger of RNA-polymerase I-specific TFIIB, Rrn7 [Caudoviricetes sp.]
MMKQTTCYSCDKPIEPEWLPEGEFIVCDECSSDTDNLSVEKLQEQLNTAKKYIEHVIGTIKHDGHLGTIQTDWILPYLEKTLAAIEIEGSGDE